MRGMTDETADTEPVVELDEAECWNLLGSESLGRLATTVGGAPDIFPINYYAADGKIVVRTGEGTKLSELSVNPSVAFEADHVEGEGAWSVVAHGTARVLVNAGEIAAADELPLTPWIPTLKYNYVEIDVSKISGRRFMFGPEPQRYY